MVAVGSIAPLERLVPPVVVTVLPSELTQPPVTRERIRQIEAKALRKPGNVRRWRAMRESL
jgi:hypothetical protein